MAKSDKRKKNRRRYGQAPLKHAKRGLISCGIAGVVFVLFALLFLIAYKTAGSAASYIGGIGIVALILAGTGCGMAVRGFKERNKNYLTCKIGIACNAIFVLSFMGVFCRGLF